MTCANDNYIENFIELRHTTSARFWIDSLSNTKRRENLIDNVSNQRLTCDHAKAVQGTMKICQGDFFREAGNQVLLCLSQCIQCLLQSLIMTLVCNYSTFV